MPPPTEDDRSRTILALDRGDRVFILAYLARTSPAAFDLAVAALAGTRARQATGDL
jgi:hypothetical protein